MNRRRLDFEGLRDGMLVVARRLDATVGGASVEIIGEPFSPRRTVYAFIDRQNLPGLFRTFDFASPDTHAPKRYETNVPQQALFLLNGPFVAEQARTLVAHAVADDPVEKARKLVRQALARDPSDAEIERLTAYVLEASTETAAVEASLWSYGYGALDSEAGRLASFTALPHFTGKAWQGGEQLPDALLGWVTLNATGGHVGNDLAHTAVRRWRVPVAGRISIRGLLKHSTKEGDGVRARILVDGANQCGVWEAYDNRAFTRVEDIAVEAGQTIDFVTDLKQTISHDEFEWRVEITLEPRDSDRRMVANASDEFSGPPPTPLDPWGQVAQVLLLSNEFQFVD
jgi:hypothetical protein